MRGWLHFWSFVVSIVSGVVLIAVAGARAGANAALATAIYSVTILGLFGVSALYHRHTWRTPRARAIMRRLDHSMIFLFIAGTYTPVARCQWTRAGPAGCSPWCGAGRWRAWCSRGVAARAVWLGGAGLHGARLGGRVRAARAAAGTAASPRSSCCSRAARSTPSGAVFYATKWPNPWPSTFGYHEFFHAAIVLAALCHLVAIWLIVLR